ncbi:hypothetical protein HAX54_010488, partial [Datura stramonium]|nr:hypothetical protein [Datura stramonium]
VKPQKIWPSPTSRSHHDTMLNAVKSNVLDSAPRWNNNQPRKLLSPGEKISHHDCGAQCYKIHRDDR